MVLCNFKGAAGKLMIILLAIVSVVTIIPPAILTIKARLIHFSRLAPHVIYFICTLVTNAGTARVGIILHHAMYLRK